MASGSKNITYSISCNTKMAQSAIDALEKRLKEVVSAMTELEKKGEDNTQVYKLMKAEAEGLGKALKDNRDTFQKLQDNINNLSGVSMRKLKETLSGIKREFDKLKNVGTDAEATKRAEWLKEKYEEVNAELKKRGLEYVNIEKVMKRIDKVSDDTLSKSIKQQEALLRSVERGTAEYTKQEGVLKRMQAEQDKRAGKEPINMQDVLGRLSSVSNDMLSKTIKSQEALVNSIARGTAEYTKQEEVLKRLNAEQDKRNGKQPVDMGGVLNRLGVVSNDTLDKAIKEQTAYVNGLELETDQYNAQAEILKKLNAEHDRRNGKIAEAQPSYAEMESVASNPMNFSENEIEAAKKYFETMRKSLKVGSAEWEKYDDYVNQCKKSLNELFSESTGTKKFSLEETLSHLSTAPIDDLKRAEKELEKQMNAVNRDTEEYVRLQADMRKVKGEIEGVNNQWKKQESALKGVFNRLAAYVGIYGAFNFLKNQIMGVVKENIAFSDTLADIRKSTGLATNEIKDLSNAINKIDTRTSREELHQLAYEAGRMGLGKYGVAGIEQFVKAADQLKVALGEDLGDDAILQLTKMADVMGLMSKYGVEDSLLKVGSAINELAQNSTAKGTYITDFASRLSGVSRQCNLTTADLFGLAAASDALALETEVSATAMSKFLVQLSQYDKQDAIAKAAGMEVEALRELVDSGQMGEAVLKVLDGLSRRGGMGQLAPIMKDLGSDGSRMVNIFSTLASNVDKVRANMVLAAEAFDEGESVTNEFNIKNNTAAAIMERTANSWKALMVNFKNSSIAKDIALIIKRLSDELQRNGILLGTMTITLYAIVAVLQVVARLLPALTMFGIGKAIVLFVAGLARVQASMTGTIGKLGAFAVKLGLVKKEILETAASTKALGEGMKAASLTNVLLAIASILTAVAIPAFQRLSGYIKDLKSNFSDVARGVAEVNVETEESTRKLNKAFDKLDELQQQGKEGSIEYLKVERQLNAEHGDLMKGLVTEEGHITSLASAREELNKKLAQSIAYRMQEKMINEASTDGIREQVDALAVLQEQLSKKGMSQEQIDNVTGFLRSNAGTLGEQSGFQRMFGLDSKTGDAVRDVIRQNGGRVGDKTFEALLPGFDVLMKLFNAQTGDQKLMAAVENYAHSVATVERRIQAIKGKLKDMIGDFKPITEEETLFGGGENGEDEAGGAGGGETKISKVKRQYEAFISLIEAYYNRKRSIAREDFNQGKMTEMQLAQQEEDINKQRLETLMAARRSMVGFDDDNAAWNRVTEEMRQLSKIEDDDLYMIAEQIARQDMGAFGATIRSFGAEMTDGIINGIESNRAELENIEVNIQKAIAKALLERDLTGKVRQEYGGSMQRLGLLSYLIPDGKTAKEAMDDVLEQMLSVYDSGALFEITDENFGEAMTEILASFTGISDEMRNMDDTRLRLLLDYMIRFGNATDEARKKLETMRHNTLLQNWDRSAQGQSLAQRARNDEREGTFIGQLAGLVGGNNVVQSQGVTAAQHEVEAIAQKIAMLRAQGDAEAELIKMNDELEAAENKLTQALIENVKDQADVIRELGGVLETAADEWGEYLGTTYETEEDAANARREIWNSMVDSVGGAIEKILQQWVTETITTAMLNQSKLAQQRQANIQMEAENARHAAAMTSTEATEVTAVGVGETAKASAKAIGTYGLKGVAIAAVASAIIGGFIKFAMAKLKKPAVETSSKAATNAANQRIVTGMLTYDTGNVQALGSDGHTYSATPVGALQTGLYTSPVATTVNGQPALVAEKGPELVIGRETTAYIRRNDPALLRALVTVDKHYSGRYRTFDSGNVSALSPALAGQGYSEADLIAVIARLNAILDKGVKANITMLGPNGLLKDIDNAKKFEQRHS